MSAAAGHFFLRVHLLVTGEAEEDHLPKLFSKIEATGVCHFVVERRIRQLSPRSDVRQLKMVGSRGHRITKRAEEEISLPARRLLHGHSDRILVLVDDLEHDRRDQVESIFELYREALDKALHEGDKPRAAVHFLVNMLEAYFFADPGALEQVLRIELEAHDGDVEEIRNPKGLLKRYLPDYTERQDGGRILEYLDLFKVLGDPQTCAWLRSCISWIVRAFRAGLDPSLCAKLDETGATCHLEDGRCAPLTLDQKSSVRDRPARR